MCLGLHLYWVLTTWNLMGGKVVSGSSLDDDEWFITWWCVVHHLVVSGSSLHGEWFIRETTDPGQTDPGLLGESFGLRSRRRPVRRSLWQRLLKSPANRPASPRMVPLPIALRTPGSNPLCAWPKSTERKARPPFPPKTPDRTFLTQSAFPGPAGSRKPL